MEHPQAKTYPGYGKRERFTFEELLDLCLRNAANSYSILEMETTAAGGISSTVTRPSPDRYIGNVLILWSHILDREKDDQFKKTYPDYPTGEEEEVADAVRLHHAIIELLDRKHFFAHKVARTLVD